MRVGQSLIQLLNEPLELGKHTVRIGASVGIAVYPEDAQEKESLCIAADLRMYDAKKDSRNNREQEISGAAGALFSIEPHAQPGLPVLD